MVAGWNLSCDAEPRARYFQHGLLPAGVSKYPAAGRRIVRRMDTVLLRGSAVRGELRPAMKRARRSTPARSNPRTPTLARTSRRPDLLIHEKLARVPSQKRSRIKREAILRAAVELFERNGYEATAIGDITKRAGTSVGGFYQYFISKRQLLLVLMNELLQKLEQIDMQPSGQGDLDRATQ